MPKNQPSFSLEELIKQRQQPDQIDYLNQPTPLKQDISVDLIDPNPYQPRRQFDELKLEELAASIKHYGIFTPLIVRANQARFQLVSGERRLRAAKRVGLSLVPVVIGTYSEERMREIALLENIQRQDLNRLEEALAYAELLKINQWTQQHLADHLGKSRSHVANVLRLLQLPASIQHLVLTHALTMGQVRPLIGLSESQLEPLLKKVLEDHLSSREVERLVRQLTPASRFLKQEKLAVEVTPTHVQIPYQNKTELKRILGKLKK